ncbi:MAG: DUF547 domain-containing protein [Bacteroidia bacterium]
MSDQIIALSEILLEKVKLKKNFKSEIEELKLIDLSSLQKALLNDNQKKVFWINLYNAFIQISGSELETNKKQYFTKKRIGFKDFILSFDDIEHGILRKGRYKYSLGYFNTVLMKASIRQLKVQKLDYRIHFALNCGAVSCPPVLFYSLNKIEDQLQLATVAFLEQSTRVDEVYKKVEVTKLFLFYLKDFGGFSGIKNLLIDKGFISDNNYKIEFDQYDWTLKLNNFASYE